MEHPIAAGFYRHESLPLSAQECLNLYPNVEDEVQTLSQEALFPTPGTVQLATSGSSNQACRGAVKMDGIAYFVNGNTLYRLSRVAAPPTYAYSLDALGAIVGTGRVSIATNGTQICIVVPGDPSSGYIFTADPDTLTPITDSDWWANGNPQAVVHVDGYFVFTTDSRYWIVSGINDGLSYNALDRGTAESNPDAPVAPFVVANQLYIAGTETIEAFNNVGGTGFPFQRSGLFIQKGLVNAFAIVDSSNSFMFIGAGRNESPAIWELAGNGVERRSTTPIEKELAGVDLSEAFAWSYSRKGAYFIGFTLPTTTLVLDTATLRWHERKSLVQGTYGAQTLERYRPNAVVAAYDGIVVGDMQDGRVGMLKTELNTEYDLPIVRRAVPPPVRDQGKRFFLPSVELTIEAGVGNDACTDPVVTMERSLDGGRTWRAPRTRAMGKQGEYQRRAIWRRNGMSSNTECLRFTVTDPVRTVFMKLELDVVQTQ